MIKFKGFWQFIVAGLEGRAFKQPLVIGSRQGEGGKPLQSQRFGSALYERCAHILMSCTAYSASLFLWSKKANKIVKTGLVLYYDKGLPMGCASSCRIFQTFSTALVWVATHKLGAQSTDHIHDDLLFVASLKSTCHTDLHRFIACCEYLGVPIAEVKTVGPLQISIAGIEIDTTSVEAPSAWQISKKGRAAIDTMQAKNAVTLKQL